MSKKLFENSDSESENENVNELKTNKDYAKVYNKFRQKELLKKLKDRGLDDSDSTESSSESSISDEDVYNPKFDEEFYKTLSSLKSKDPSIYDKNSKFFENFDGIKKNKDQTENGKALTLKDYERKVIVEKGGIYEDDEDSENENKEIKRPMSPSYIEDQKQLKKEFKQILNDDDGENEEFGGLFKRRNKTEEEEEKEEKDFIQWLAGKKQDIDENKKKKLNPLKQYWNNPNLSKEEQFLRDYVLNNGYINKSDDIPTYEEIVGDENLSDDEKELEKQADFELKYNFRYEEPDKEFIKRYPRTIENSVRKEDDRRKLKRLEVKERKKQEKEEKYKELEVLKALKKKEIEDKIQKLKEVTGNEELPFGDDDFEGDFDPEAHDKRMKEIFNDDYYQIEEGEEKPECPDIEELKIEDWDNFDPAQDDDGENDNQYEDNECEPHCEDDDFIMDCDYEENCKEKLQNELIENTKDKRKRRRGRKNHFMEIIKKEKPVFNPDDEKTYAQYIDEYYKIDCEDIIGDTPCRFKYVETVPNDFGLTIEEILLAKNKELNQWASLKKAVQIRSEHVERNEVKLYQLKAQNWKLKKKIFRSLYGSSSEDEEEREISENKEIMKSRDTEVKVENVTNKNQTDFVKNKKNKNPEIRQDDKSNAEKITNGTIVDQSQKKKKKKKSKVNNNSNNDVSVNNVDSIASKASKKRKNPFDNNKNGAPNHKKKKFLAKSDPNKTISEERLKAYGLNPKKFYKKQKFMNQKLKNKSKS